MKLSANIVKKKLKLTIPSLKGFVHFTTVEPICISDVQNVQEFVIVLKNEIQLKSKLVNIIFLRKYLDFNNRHAAIWSMSCDQLLENVVNHGTGKMVFRTPVCR